jgi:acyl carrier protein
MRLEKEFGIKIGSSEESRRALTSVAAMAAYLRSHQPASAVT